MSALLALNAGSSTIKFAVYALPGLVLLARGVVDAGAKGVDVQVHGPRADIFDSGPSGAASHAQQLNWILSAVERANIDVSCVGHRVVHGGKTYTHATPIDDATLTELHRLSPLAPAHQPVNLAGIDAVARLWPHMPQAACFDTAFHRSIPRVAQLFPIPRALSDAGLIRYGFHGLSYQHVADVMRARGQAQPFRRVLAAHLGNGASLCGLKDGVSVATTMGLTALDGLMMGTRSGAIDPGLVLHLIEQQGMTPADVGNLLHKSSGLLGVSGISGDMRELEMSAAPEAAEAIDLFAYRAAREAGSIIVALQGLDAIAFTGGIGEHSARTRAAICERLAFLGVQLDRAANEHHAEIISAAGSSIPVHIVAADEELQIARECAGLFGGARADSAFAQAR